MQKPDFVFWLTDQEGVETQLIIPERLFKYFDFFNGLYEQQILEGREEEHYRLDTVLWTWVLEVVKESLDSPITRTGVAADIATILLPDLYRLLSIMDYYGQRSIVNFLMNEIAQRLITMPLTQLRLSHPKARLPLVTDVIAEVQKTNYTVAYSARRKLISLILARYVQTSQLIQLIIQRFPKRRSGMAAGNNFLMIITQSGLVSVGGSLNGPGHERAPTQQQLIDLLKQSEPQKVTLEVANRLLQTTSLSGEERLKYLDLKRKMEMEITRIMQTPLPLFLGDNTEVVSVSCGTQHAAIVTNQGLLTTGFDRYGVIGSSKGLFASEPSQFLHKVALDDVLGVECGVTHTVAMTTRGMYIWGKAYNGKDASLSIKENPQPLAFVDARVRDFACGLYTTVVVDGHGYVYYYNKDGITQKVVPGGALIREVVSGLEPEHFVFLDSEGKVYVMGSNTHGQLGLGTLLPSTDDIVELVLPEGVKCTKIYAGSRCSFFKVAKEQGQLYACGDNSDLRLGVVDLPHAFIFKPRRSNLPAGERFRDVAATSNIVYYKIETDLVVSGKLPELLETNLWRPTGITLHLPQQLQLEEADQDERPTKRLSLRCYHCGVTTKSLPLHGRVFCNTQCLSEYTQMK